ncbi:MAG: hypothetical protein WC953_13480 [Pseudomonas sp.]
MLIPGLPPAGAQQEAFKPDRKVRTTAVDGLAHEPLAELPVEGQPAFQYTGGHAGRDESGEQQAEAPVEQSETTVSGAPELPRKGLLVDIRA